MKNVLKQKLQNKENIIGTFISFYAPSLIEMASYAGFDFVVIDDEHGAFSSPELEVLIRTADGVGITPIVRVSYDSSSIQKALDRGAHGIHVPMVNTKEEAEEVVRKAKFPPEGERGVSYSIRPARYGKDNGSTYLKECNDNILIIVHIETQQAADNFKDIINTEGIDMAFIGSTDLSVNMGYYDDGANHPEVKAVIENLYSIAEEHDIIMGTVAGTGAKAKEAFSQGSQYVCTVMNGIVSNALSQTVKEGKV